MDWLSTPLKPTSWKNIRRGVAFSVGVYLVVWLSFIIGHPYLEEPQYEVSDCVDSRGDVRTCDDPDAVEKLVREAESPSACQRQAAYYEEELLPVFPWIPEDGFCARPLK